MGGDGEMVGAKVTVYQADGYHSFHARDTQVCRWLVTCVVFQEYRAKILSQYDFMSPVLLSLLHCMSLYRQQSQTYCS